MFPPVKETAIGTINSAAFASKATVFTAPIAKHSPISTAMITWARPETRCLVKVVEIIRARNR